VDRPLQTRQLACQAAVVPSRKILHSVTLLTTSPTHLRPVSGGACTGVVTEGLVPLIQYFQESLEAERFFSLRLSKVVQGGDVLNYLNSYNLISCILSSS